MLKDEEHPLFVRVGDGAEADAAEFVVLPLPDFFRLLALQLAADALVYLHLPRRALVEPPPERTRRAVAVPEVLVSL